MRTNIELDDELMAQAMEATGLTTKKATVEEPIEADYKYTGEEERKREAFDVFLIEKGIIGEMFPTPASFKTHAKEILFSRAGVSDELKALFLES